MAKKSRKARAKTRTSQPVSAVESREPAAGRIPNSAERQRRAAGVAAAVAAPVSHDYVKSDLVRIGIIAGALIIVIIVLTLLPALQS